jgi:hypothetical protein
MKSGVFGSEEFDITETLCRNGIGVNAIGYCGVVQAIGDFRMLE